MMGAGGSRGGLSALAARRGTVDVRTQIVAGNAGDALNIKNALGRNLRPLGNALRREAQFLREG